MYGFMLDLKQLTCVFIANEIVFMLKCAWRFYYFMYDVNSSVKLEK